MFSFTSLYSKVLVLLLVGILSNINFAQNPDTNLKGQVVDQQNAIIVGATVEAIDANGKSKTVVTNEQGEFNFKNLMPGKYTIRATQEGFAFYENSDMEIKSNSSESLKITLEVSVAIETVSVEEEAPINTNMDVTAGTIVLKGDTLEGIPDNPDDIEAYLQSLAGPGAGPNGGEILIDNMPGGRMPPKSSIREIRINSNPYSAEYDRVGFGRIEIFTKPGTNGFHGQAFFNFNDESLNSRNPFTTERAPYQARQYGGNFSGSFSKKGSFFVDFERRAIDDLAVVNANILDGNLNVVPFTESIASPSIRTTFSPRIDYQLNDTNSLMARYSFTRTNNENNGIGGFSLGSRAYNVFSTEQSFQLTETAVINKSIINETRFQYVSRKSENSLGDSSLPTIQVLDAFTSGGANVGNSSSSSNRWELSNSTSWTKGKHSFKTGVRLRGISINDISENNFAGTYTFTSLDQYRNVLLGINGANPTQFTITAGNPEAQIKQIDFGAFLQDDWRILPNLTLSLGLRYEAQTNVSNNKNFAPRLGFAWSPDYANGRNGKTVVRGGFGVFFDRVGESLSMNAVRFNGLNRQSYIVTDPTLLAMFPNVPSIDTLLDYATTQNKYQLSGDIRAPYNVQTSFGIERQLPFNFTAAVNYINTKGYNQLRLVNVNSPVNYIYGDPTSGIRPFGDVGNIFEYQSNGKFSQNQLSVNIRNNFNNKFSIFTNYTLGNARSDTDGANSFPANSYDLTDEYGRSSMDVRHRLTIGGSVKVPFGFSLNPFVIISSGRPFNITTGQDTNGDSLFTERPTYAQLNTKCNTLGLSYSFCDISNISDINSIIPRNYGTGPSFATVNLRLSRTFGFGGESASSGGNFGSGGGRGGRGGDVSTSKKYNLTFSIQAQNLFNTTNAGNPIGNMSSALFGVSNSLGGGFGWGGGSSSAFNRRIEAQIRFSF